MSPKSKITQSVDFKPSIAINSLLLVLTILDAIELICLDELPLAIREIFELTVSLGGTISGEHGIGLVQKQYMDIPFKSVELELMQSIKAVFDPKMLLNPGKII